MKKLFTALFLSAFFLNPAFAEDTIEIDVDFDSSYAEVEEVNAEVVAEESEITKLEEQIATIRAEIKNRKTKILKLKAQVRTSTAAQKRVSDNQKKVEEVKQEKEEIRDQKKKMTYFSLNKKDATVSEDVKKGGKVTRENFENTRKNNIQNQVNKMKNYSRYFRNKFGTTTTTEFESTESE